MSKSDGTSATEARIDSLAQVVLDAFVKHMGPGAYIEKLGDGYVRMEGVTLFQDVARHILEQQNFWLLQARNTCGDSDELNSRAHDICQSEIRGFGKRGSSLQTDIHCAVKRALLEEYKP